MDEWAQRFRQYEITFALMQTNEETARDRQMQANGVFAEIEPGIRTVSSPFVVDGVEKAKPTKAPQVGEHTSEVLLGLGYSQAEVDDLQRRGAALARPAQAAQS
jgi:formyl-CoA transferase